jgi:deoxyribose-phosphate aldolase
MTTTQPMGPKDLARYIDHTLLKPDSGEAQIEALCQEALHHGFYAVCVQGSHVARAVRVLGGSPVRVAQVVAFPHGAMATRAKAAEAEAAVADGASELDMVLRIDLVKSASYVAVESDIAAVVRAAPGVPVKVILETGYLTDAEIVSACQAAEQAGAAFVKTCTGFAPGEATVEHVKLMRASVSSHVSVKASGGVRSFERACAMIEAGASRIGTSSGVLLVTGASAQGGY